MVETTDTTQWNANYQQMPGLSRRLTMAEVEEMPSLCRALFIAHNNPNHRSTRGLYKKILNAEARKKIMLMY
jgi:hypothetical protein